MKTTPTFRIEQQSTVPTLVSDRPHEDFQINYVNVVREGKVWHMWYEAYDHNYKSDADGYLCYARSADGVKWEKPDLGLVEYGGNKSNNILIAGAPIGGVHGHTVFLDSSAPAAERFKLVFTKNVDGGWLVAGGTSPDGIHWKLIDKLLLARNSDTQTVCFRDGDVYRMYVRMWSKGVFSGQRLVGYTESKTFGDFPDPVAILSPDEKDAPDFHFYNSAATKLKDSLYVMFPSAYHGKTGIVIPHMAISSDGRTWGRVGREPKIPLGHGFDSKSIYVGPGAVSGDKPGTWWIYYAGYAAGHDDQYQTKVQRLGGVGRFLLVEEDPKNMNKKLEAENGIVCRLPGERFGYFGWPTVARMTNGTLVVASSGLREEHICPFGKTVLNISKDDGRTWSAPRVIQDSIIDDRDCGLCLWGAGNVLVTWFRMDPRSYLDKGWAAWPSNKEERAAWEAAIAGWDETRVKELLGSWSMLSRDAGVTWSKPVRVPVSTPHGPIRLRSGELLYIGKIYGTWDDMRNASIAAARSKDDGLTWEVLGQVPVHPGTDPANYHEPHVVELPSGTLLGLIRIENGGGKDLKAAGLLDFSIMQTESADGGRTWSVPKPLGFHGSPPHLLRHSSGLLILTYGYRQKPFGQRVAFSRDDGKTWDHDWIIRDDGPDGDLGYPSTVELADGSLFTVCYQKAAAGEKCSLLWSRWKLP